MAQRGFEEVRVNENLERSSALSIILTCWATLTRDRPRAGLSPTGRRHHHHASSHLKAGQAERSSYTYPMQPRVTYFLRPGLVHR